MRWPQSRLRRRRPAWLPAGRSRFRAPTARDRRSRLRRRSPVRQPAGRSRSSSTHGAGSAEQTSAAEAPRGCRQCDPGAVHSRRGIGGADFGGEAPRGCRQCDPGAVHSRRGIGGADFGGGGAWRGRRGGIGGADCGGEVRKIVRQIDSGCGQARGLAARSGLLQLRRPAYRAALRLALLPGARPHRAGRARRRRGAGKSQAPLFCPSPFPARSPAALRAARLGDVSNMAAPEIGAARDTSPGRRAAGAGCCSAGGAGGGTRCGVRVRTLRVAMRRRHRGPPGAVTSCRLRRSHPGRRAGSKALPWVCRASGLRKNNRASVLMCSAGERPPTSNADSRSSDETRRSNRTSTRNAGGPVSNQCAANLPRRSSSSTS